MMFFINMIKNNFIWISVKHFDVRCGRSQLSGSLKNQLFRLLCRFVQMFMPKNSKYLDVLRLTLFVFSGVMTEI